MSKKLQKGSKYEQFDLDGDGVVTDKEHTTCRLAKQLLEDKTRVCVYVGANYTQWNEFVPIGAGECPREIQCKYRPNEKPFTLKNVIRSIKDSFK